MLRNYFFIISFFIFLFSGFGYSQKIVNIKNLPMYDYRKFHFGVYLGMNYQGHQVSYKNFNTTIEQNILPGFNIGLTAEYRISKYFSLRIEPGLFTGNNALTFSSVYKDIPAHKSEAKVLNTLLHLPVLIKFGGTRDLNLKAYLITGLAYDYNFSSNENNPDDNSSGIFRLKSSLFTYEIGFGYNLYLDYFKFSPSLRGVFGIGNNLKYDESPTSPWTSGIDNFVLRGIYLNLSFEADFNYF